MKLRFDVFSLDDASRQLWRGEHEVHLPPKAFELLAMLVKARPRVVSKRELRDALWPDTFVTEASLGMLVRQIRSALEDDARQPRFVRTVHRIGYAFKADVIEGPESLSDRATSTTAGYWLATPTQRIRLAPGENLVGRDPQTAVWIDAAEISRHHARIIVEGDRVMLEDLGSRNGTFLRGAAVTTPVPLVDGDEILFATVCMTFRVWTDADTAART